MGRFRRIPPKKLVFHPKISDETRDIKPSKGTNNKLEVLSLTSPPTTFATPRQRPGQWPIQKWWRKHLGLNLIGTSLVSPTPQNKMTNLECVLKIKAANIFTLGFMYSSTTTCLWKFRWGGVVSWVLKKKERKPVVLQFSSDLFQGKGALAKYRLRIGATLRKSGSTKNPCLGPGSVVPETVSSSKPLRPGQSSVSAALYYSFGGYRPLHVTQEKLFWNRDVFSVKKKEKPMALHEMACNTLMWTMQERVVFVTQGDRMPHVATTFWMHRNPIPLFNVHPTKTCFNFVFWKILS